MESVGPSYGELLREMSKQPQPDSFPCVVHPSLWNGYFDVTHPSNIFARFFRWAGKKLKWYRMYRMGLKVSYFIGLKYVKEMLDE